MSPSHGCPTAAARTLVSHPECSGCRPIENAATDRLRDLALTLTCMGRRVFPVRLAPRPDGTWDKKPLIRGYHGRRPYSKAELERMPWAAATHLGMALFPGEVALDIDVKAGKRGKEQFEGLSCHLGELPRTVSQTTMTGGLHLLFRGKLPERLVGRLQTVDGRPADIDVIHTGHRFLVLYEVDRLIRDWGPFAELPDSWCRVLAKAGVALGVTADRVPERREIADLIGRVAATREWRNQTLNDSVFLAVKSWQCSAQDLEAFREAGLSTGLPEDEVDRVLVSAVSGALRDGAEPISWYLAVKAASNAWSRRNTTTLVDAAAVLARTSHLTGKQRIDMSARCLAEELGLSHKSAAAALRVLASEGWLKSRSGGRDRGNSYLLVTPNGSRGDIQPLLPEGCMSPLDAADRVRLRLRRLSAFQRIGTGVVLPPGVLAVASALLSGERHLPELGDAAGCSRSTLRRAIAILESAGLVEVDDGTVRPLAADFVGALEAWAVAMGVDGRPEARAQLHRFERGSFAKRESDLQRAVADVLAARAERATVGTFGVERVQR